jgi:hypothetical protein
MAESFLLPEDVSEEHARQVLDFINQAASAQVVAEAVEFPRELDVGVRIAQRIIARRTELNGFRTLDQLYAVPYVGPERFTEIVVSLSGARPPRGAVGAGVTPSELAELRRSVAALRSMLEGAVQARLWSVQGTIWVGQSATVLALVSDAGGRALIDQPLIVTTSWGELNALAGVAPAWGQAVVARSNEVGLVELRLRPRFQAPLSDGQRLALELAAAQLPPAAAWPTAAGKALSDLVQRYRAPGSDDLREAIDAAFREYGASVERAEHRGQALSQWAQMPVSLVGFVNDEGDERGARHLALATHVVTVRNWLPAFLATFEDDVAADGRLAAELRRARRETADASDFLNDVFVSMRSFLNAERGELGQAIRSLAAQRELQDFLQTGIADLPEAARLDALVGVRDASKTIGEGGLTLFTAVDANRRDTRARFDLDAGVLGNRLGALERTAVTRQQLDDVRAEILQQTRAVADLSSSLNGLNTRITRDMAALNTRVDRIASQLPGRG